MNEQIEMSARRGSQRQKSGSGAEGRRAKRRAKELSAMLPESDDEPEHDPARPFTEREIRNLYRAYGRYGCLDDCWNEIIKDSGLKDRDPDLIRSTIQDLIELSREAISKHRSTEDPTGKKEKKAILFDYKGTRKLNAETIVIRPIELKILRKFVEKSGPNLATFRVHDVKSVHNWSCDWGAREDGMLCVGIVKHGYGAWSAIRDDPDLGMHDKFFLEEHRVEKKEERGKAETGVKSPGAVHLVRRADYLMGVLKEREEISGNGRSPPLTLVRSLKRNGNATSMSPVPSTRKFKVVSARAGNDTQHPRDRERAQSIKKRKHDRNDDKPLMRKKSRPSLNRADSSKKSRDSVREEESLPIRKKQRPTIEHRPSSESKPKTNGIAKEKDDSEEKRDLSPEENHARVRPNLILKAPTPV